jgi:AraC-like DNA-binding protein
MELFTVEQPFVFGAARYERGGHYGPVRHPHLDIAYLASGIAHVCADGRRSVTEAGQVSFRYTQYELEVTYPASGVQEAMWCHTGALLAPLQSIDLVRKVPDQVKPSRLLLTLLTEGNALGDGADAGTSRVRNALGVALVNEYLRIAQAEEDWRQLPKQIERAKSFIDAHFTMDEDLSLGRLAGVSALSPNYLLEAFRRHLGKTPNQYLWHLRVSHGVKLLLKTGLPVSAVAFESGFKCPHHFARVVKRDYGASPSDLRREKWASDPILAGSDVIDEVY